jgi:hypothetical protein
MNTRNEEEAREDNGGHTHIAIRTRRKELRTRREGMEMQWEGPSREFMGMEAAGRSIEDAEEAAGARAHQMSSSCAGKMALETTKTAIRTKCFQN